MQSDSIVGAILAGGAGHRIGGDKALVDLCGKPLIAYAARPLRACAEVTIVGAAKAAVPLGASAIEDAEGVARGPLAGICAAMEWAQLRAPWLAIVPCDTPFLPDDLVKRLAETARTQGARVVCARSAPRGLQPLVSLWETGLAAQIRAAAQAEKYPPMRRLVEVLGAAFVELSEDELENINTPETLAAARARVLTARG